MDGESAIFMRRLAMGIAASTAISGGALAQPLNVDPDGIGVHATPRAAAHLKHDAALEISIDPVAADPVLQDEMVARMERHRRELLPEYQRRVALHGQLHADAWLRGEAEQRALYESHALVSLRERNTQGQAARR